jgi:hypothetical protein
MEKTKQEFRKQEAAKHPTGMFEASPNNGYTLSMAWEVQQ